jgi:hypothetical protein
LDRRAERVYTVSAGLAAQPYNILWDVAACAQTEGQLRLQGGDRTSNGRLEIYHNNTWGECAPVYFFIFVLEIISNYTTKKKQSKNNFNFHKIS